MRALCVGVCCLLSIAVAARADVIVVDPSGSGDALTIQAGLDLASPGEEVRVVPGTYQENLIMKSGVRLVSQSGPTSTVIDGLGARCIECAQCATGTLIQGFTLTNGGGHDSGGIRIYDGSDVEVAGNIITDNHTYYEGAGVQVQRYSYGDIHDNVFSDNTSYHSCAISVIVGAQATIAGNVFRNNYSEFLSAGIGLNESYTEIYENVFIENTSTHGATIHAVHSSTITNIHHNTFLFNHGTSDGGSGIYCYSDAQMTASHNIFAWNTGRAAVLSGGGSLTLECNCFWENDIHWSGLPSPIGVDGNFIDDPMVCAPLEDEAPLSMYSPCLNGPCGVIGANPDPACTDIIPTESVSWGQVKAGYR